MLGDSCGHIPASVFNYVRKVEGTDYRRVSCITHGHVGWPHRLGSFSTLMV